MVVFTCSNCGESLKKNKVDHHFMYKCRSRPLLTCVDCLKDFNCEEYVSHTKCVSEEVRYGEKGFVPKPSANKGERKQAERMRLLSEYIQESRVVDADVKEILERIIQLENVPNRKPALFNMIRNQKPFRRVRDSVLERVWAVMEEINTTFSSTRQSTNDSDKQVQESGESSLARRGQDEAKDKKKKKKKLKGEPSSEVQCDDDGEGIGGVAQVSGVEIDKIEETKITLSKKKKKEKRKREKYERELMAVEGEAGKSVVMGETESKFDDMSSYKKQSRKRKHSLMNEDSNKENGVNPPGEEIKKSKKKKKKKKSHGSEHISEANTDKEDCEKKPKSMLVGGEPTVENMAEAVDVSKESKSHKFDWTETIIAVLRNKNELPLKRLQKKVVNEYLSSGGSEKSIEKAIAKFKKKVQKIPCIKVKKERVKLVL